MQAADFRKFSSMQQAFQSAFADDITEGARIEHLLGTFHAYDVEYGLAIVEQALGHLIRVCELPFLHIYVRPPSCGGADKAS